MLSTGGKCDVLGAKGCLFVISRLGSDFAGSKGLDLRFLQGVQCLCRFDAGTVARWLVAHVRIILDNPEGLMTFAAGTLLAAFAVGEATCLRGSE